VDWTEEPYYYCNCSCPPSGTALSLGRVHFLSVFCSDPTLAFPAKVYLGPSRQFAPERSTIIDYTDFDHAFNSYWDEIREVYPGVWLGRLYQVTGFQGTMDGYRLMFALFRSSPTGKRTNLERSLDQAEAAFGAAPPRSSPSYSSL